MATRSEKNKIPLNGNYHSDPPGKIKIVQALKKLLEEKDFNSITTAEIAKTSGVNESLIYRYFKDKRGLLHYILAEGMRDSENKIRTDLRDIKGPVNKLRKLIWDSIYYYDRHRVFAKILLLEVRNFPGYFESETYQLARQYSRILLNLIKEGIADYISMSRPLIREPGLVKRWGSGDLRKAACLSDNQCFEPARAGEGIYCVVERKEKQ